MHARQSYRESIATIRSINLSDQKTHLQIVIPSCRINALYHLGISHLMSRNYIDALEIFENVYMYMTRCSKSGISAPTVGSAKSGLDQLIKKMSDKILALICICISLCPSKSIDEQIRENIGMKWGEKLMPLKPGLLLMWPAFLEHGTFVNETPADRISFSFNVTLSKPPYMNTIAGTKVEKIAHLYVPSELPPKLSSK